MGNSPNDSGPANSILPHLPKQEDPKIPATYNQDLWGSYLCTLSTWGPTASEDPKTRKINPFLPHTQCCMEQKQENHRKRRKDGDAAVVEGEPSPLADTLSPCSVPVSSWWPDSGPAWKQPPSSARWELPDFPLSSWPV